MDLGQICISRPSFIFPGPLSAPIGVEGNAFIATKYANESWPDIQITFIASHPGFDGGTLYKGFLAIKTKVRSIFKSTVMRVLILIFQVFDEYFLDNAYYEGFSMYPILMRPKSRGRISLRSSDPSDHPVIQPNYLSHPDDIKTLIEGHFFLLSSTFLWTFCCNFRTKNGSSNRQFSCF